MKDNNSIDIMEELNKLVNEFINPNIKSKGTSYWYIKGQIGNKKVCYTKAKTYFKGKCGFYSWIETRYKKGIIKRTKIAKSGSKKKAEERANKLLKKIELKGGNKE